jgi:hypothetical protein
MPYVLVWTILILPAVRNMSRGWRPFADDASIAIRSWATLTLHPPLVGQITGATTGAGVQSVADPGPLELWFLGPFVHLDPGQGALIGSVLLCGAALSLAIHLLKKTTGTWAAVIFALVIADLALVSPTPYLDPVWNSSFAFFWFLSFMAVAFVVGRGYLIYLPILLFLGSVTVDSHLLFLPSVAGVLVASPICGWHFNRPRDYRWLWWTGGVGVACWLAPGLQELFGAHPNISLLVHGGGIGAADNTKTFGVMFGLRALSRAASLNPIWASPRSIAPLASNADISQRNILLSIVLIALVAIAIVAWRQKNSSLCSMSLITAVSAFGVVVLYSRIPQNFVLSLVWVSLVVWVVGICIWLTLGLAVFTAVRPRISFRSPRITKRTGEIVSVAALGVCTVAGTLVVLFPYGNQFLLNLTTMHRVNEMAAIVERNVHRGDVDIAIHYNGSNYFQVAGDEHGVAYLLEAAGWQPGLDPSVNALLGLPIHPHSREVVFDERGAKLVGFRVIRHYNPWAALVGFSPVRNTTSASR